METKGNRSRKSNKKKKKDYKKWKIAASEAMKKMAELIALGTDVGGDSCGSDRSYSSGDDSE